jgi:glycerophosphoryl diester phosphodiesterase
MSFPLRLLDRTYRTAWLRFLRRWRTMAAWTLLVWASFSVVLMPLLSAGLARAVFRRDSAIVANHELLEWLLRPEGFAYVMILAGLSIMAGIVRYAGLFRIVSDDLLRRPVSVRQTILEISPDIPWLFKLCLAGVLAAAIAAAPLFGGLALIYSTWLGDYDINYYLAARPPEWSIALRVAFIWVGLWAVGAVYLLLRLVPVLPAYLDGHRPLHLAVVRSWQRTQGRAFRVLWLFIMCVVTWLLVRGSVHAAVAVVAAPVFERLIAVGTVAPLVVFTAGYAAITLLADALISFVGFAFASTVLTKFYYEDTDLHASIPPVDLRLAGLPTRVVSAIRRWGHPRRAVPVALVLVLSSGALGVVLINQVVEPRTVLVIAHRAGAFMAPENTLLALERTIEAGADYAEIDVQRTRDSIVVVVHDADLMRVAGSPLMVTETTFHEIAHLQQGQPGDGPPEERRIATLPEFLERSRDRIGLIVELKYYAPDPVLLELVLRDIREAGMEDHVMLMSLELGSVRRAMKLAPEIPSGYLTTVVAGDPTRLDVAFLAVPGVMLTPRLARNAHRRDMPVFVWTVNRQDRMVDLIRRGADGIITDDPPLAASVRAEFDQLLPVERLLLRFGLLLFEPGNETSSARHTE